MIEVRCDICQAKLPGKQPAGADFCDRCAPFAQEFLIEASKIADELRAEANRRINRLRTQFCQTKINQKAPLKAVADAGKVSA